MSTNTIDPPAADVLFGRTRRSVLGWLYGHPDEAFYLRQIVRYTGAAHGAVQRELAALTGAGLLRRTVQGRQVYFQANRASPLFSDLQSILIKTTGLVGALREALRPLADRIVVAFVFGSAARGELRRDSDIDLLVVGDATFAEIAECVARAQQRLGRDGRSRLHQGTADTCGVLAKSALPQPVLLHSVQQRVARQSEVLGRLGPVIAVALERLADQALLQLLEVHARGR
jgi:predicted nucleotidyltransferase